MKWKHIDLGLYAKEKKCIIERDIQRNTEIVNMKSLKKTIQKELKNIETSVVIDGHYSHELFNDNEVSYVFVLRKAPWELQKVLKLRKYAKEKILENIEAEILGIVMQEAKEKFIKEKLFEIDGTQKTSERIVLEIQDIIDGKTTNSYSIDWMNCAKTLLLLEKNSCS
jgi:adenylate kinase